MNKVKQYVVSRTPGRLRLRIPTLKNPEIQEEVLDSLNDVAGIESADINPRTGSLLVITNPEVFDEVEFDNVLAKHVGHPKPAPTITQKTQSVLRSPKMRAFENRSMVVLGATTLAAIFMRSWGLHTWAGAAFTGVTMLHTYRYRKQLWR